MDPKKIPVDDPKVLQLFSGTESLGVTPEEIGCLTGTLGIPEFGTRFVRQMLEDTRPTTFGELVRISGLSHGTDVWLNNAQDLIRSGTAVLSEVIATRDDIMVYLIYKGMKPKTAFNIMEKVRKGKGLTEEEEEEMKAARDPGLVYRVLPQDQIYVSQGPCGGLRADGGSDRLVQGVLSRRVLCHLFHRPGGRFRSGAGEQGEGSGQPENPEINEKGADASPKEKGLLTVLESAREMMARGLTFHSIDLYRSDATRFLVDGDALLPPFSSVSGIGASAARNIVKAREEGDFLSIEDFQKRSRVSSAVVEVLERLGCLRDLPENNQLSLF